MTSAERSHKVVRQPLLESGLISIAYVRVAPVSLLCSDLVLSPRRLPHMMQYFIRNFVASAPTGSMSIASPIETVGMTCYTDTYLRIGEHWLCALAQLTSVAPAIYPSDETIVVRYFKGVLQSE